MNIQSMTGYGMGEAGGLKVEVRSTNHKGLHIQVNLPSYLYYYEPEIRNLVKERFHRGYIEIFFSNQNIDGTKLRINKTLAKGYYEALVSLKHELSIPEEIGLNILAQQRDIFTVEETEVDIPAFRQALETALDDLKKMRLKEGKNLLDDIVSRIHSLDNSISQIEDNRMEFVTNARAVLAEKLKSLIGNILIDDSRLMQEVAILVERLDITEEIVRTKSHLKHMEDVFFKSDVVGKKAGFLVQEVHRELNTIGSKAPGIEISSLLVEMKYEIEKIREQIQNLQ